MQRWRMRKQFKRKPGTMSSRSYVSEALLRVSLLTHAGTVSSVPQGTHQWTQAFSNWQSYRTLAMEASPMTTRHSCCREYLADFIQHRDLEFKISFGECIPHPIAQPIKLAAVLFWSDLLSFHLQKPWVKRRVLARKVGDEGSDDLKSKGH